jgi:protein-S-isoprenylcysteine O-methyltransferase Ste14
VGGSLFRQRTWLPLPIAVALVLLPSHPLASPFLAWTGAGLVASGELLRLWAVRHIGVVSRTRSDRLGPLVATGPFARLRNPLYVGNIALWVGFAASAGLVWLIPPIVLLLAFEYHAIVRWEEHLLEGRLGDDYREYAARVPRWIPLASPVSRGPQVPGLKFSWRDTLFSERGTLMAIVGGYLLLWYKSQV